MDVNTQHATAVNAPKQVPLVHCQTVNESERAGKCNHPPGGRKAALSLKSVASVGNHSPHGLTFVTVRHIPFPGMPQN